MIKQGRCFFEAPHCSRRKKRWPAGLTPLRGNRNSEDKKDDTGPKPSRFKSRAIGFREDGDKDKGALVLLPPKKKVSFIYYLIHILFEIKYTCKNM